MREILFRGKCIDNGEWAYGYFVSQDKESYIFEQLEVDKGIDFGGYLDCCQMCEVIPETVGQFTGLTDKNGEKIFEGDIVRAMMDWGPAGMVETMVDIGFKKYDGYRWNYFDLDTIEVISNIHDNPELLRVK